MATLKQRLHRKNSSNIYDTIHLESESGVILRPNGRYVETDLGNLPITRTTAGDPTGLIPVNQIAIGPSNAIYLGLNDGIAVFEGNSVYRWNRYNTNTSWTYYWNTFDVVSSYTPAVTMTTATINKTGSFNGSTNARLYNNTNTMIYYAFASYSSLVDQSSGIFRLTSSLAVGRYVYGGTPITVNYYNNVTYSGSANSPSYGVELYAGTDISPGNMPDRVVTYRGHSTTTSSPTFTVDIYTAWIVHNQSQGSTNLGQITGSSRYQYPDNGAQNGKWYVYDRSVVSYSQGSLIDQVMSTNPSQYPTNGRHTDGYWYVKIS